MSSTTKILILLYCLLELAQKGEMLTPVSVKSSRDLRSFHMCEISNSSNGGLRADCSNRAIQTVSRIINTKVKYLSLKHNDISYLHNGIFSGMSNLITLDISNNLLSGLHKDTFKGLTHLLNLDVSYNNMKLNYTCFPPGLFAPTPSLKRLNLMQDFGQHTHLPKTLADLKHLEELTTSGEMFANEDGGTIPYEYSQLHKLRTLDFKNSAYPNITESTFAYLKDLNITALGLRNFEHPNIVPTALKTLKNLQTLNLDCSIGTGLKKAFQIVKDANLRNMHALILDRIEDSIFYMERSIVCSTPMKYLSILTLRSNKIVMVDVKSFECFPNLKYISIGYNGIISSVNGYHNLSDLKFLPSSLRTLDISHFGSQHAKSFPAKHCWRKESSSIGISGYEGSLRFKPILSPLFNPNVNSLPLLRKNYKVINITYFPKSLQYLYADFMPKISFDKDRPHVVIIPEDNQLLYLNWSFSDMNFLNAYLTGLNSLQVLDLSHNKLVMINFDLLKYVPRLRYLNISNNMLGKSLENKLIRFSDCKYMTDLNLAYNQIDYIHFEAFADMMFIKYLNLKGNYLTKVHIESSTLQSLVILDLSYNHLKNLDNEMISRLKDIHSNMSEKGLLTITLGDNPLTCDCVDSFVEWFVKTKVNIPNRNHLTCTLGSETKTIVNLVYHKSDLCFDNDKKPLVVGVVTGFTVFGTCLTIVVMSYMLRWKIRWQYYRLKWKFLRKNHLNHVNIPLWAYDAFVAHSHEHDYRWVRNKLLPRVETDWGLRLCIGERDFLAGVSIAENIVTSIDKSKKTIVILNTHFLASKWCEFEIQMALTSKGGLKSLVIVLMEDLDTTQLEATLRGILRTTNYIKWERNADAFWMKLHCALNS